MGRQVAILRETDGKGPYCSLVMAVIVVKDVIVFMCFAINIEFVRVVRTPVSHHAMVWGRHGLI